MATATAVTHRDRSAERGRASSRGGRVLGTPMARDGRAGRERRFRELTWNGRLGSWVRTGRPGGAEMWVSRRGVDVGLEATGTSCTS